MKDNQGSGKVAQRFRLVTLAENLGIRKGPNREKNQNRKWRSLI